MRGTGGLVDLASVVAPAGLIRESPAAFGLALPGFVELAGAACRGLTQQRTDRLPELEVLVRP
jgi:hypothetical protein